MNRLIRIVTDFDGPIMDVSERYYQAYLHCLDQVARPRQSVTVLPKSKFWELKRSQVPERKIGQISGLDELQAQEFAHLRRRTVHTMPYLTYDTVKPGAIETLERIQQLGFDLVVMTMRRQSELKEAFDRCHLARFFPMDRCYCLANDYVKTKDIDDKPLLMQRAMVELPKVQETWMIGDTEADIMAAKTGRASAIAVLSGIRNQTQLAMHNPDWIVADLPEALEIILQATSSRYAG